MAYDFYVNFFFTLFLGVVWHLDLLWLWVHIRLRVYTGCHLFGSTVVRHMGYALSYPQHKEEVSNIMWYCLVSSFDLVTKW